MTTLKDVAEKAGVSLTTVSLVANGKAKENRITEATVQRVQATMEELRYAPNQNARLLRSGTRETSCIALFWPQDRRPAMLGIRLAHLQQTIFDQSMDLEIAVQFFRSGQIRDSLTPAILSRFDGMIVGSTTEEDIAQLEEIPLPIPAVLLNRSSRKLSTVGVDNTVMGREIASLIKKKGYHSCAIIRSRELYSGVSARMKAFLLACKEMEIETQPEWIFIGSGSIAGGARAAEEYICLKDRPRVLFFESDAMAQGGQFLLQKKGIRIPEDAELITVGTQSPEAMEYLNPPISAVSIPPNVDRQALYTILRLLREKPGEPIHIPMEPLIQLRGSFSL